MTAPIDLKLVKPEQNAALLETFDQVRKAVESGEVLGFCVVLPLTGREQMLAHYVTKEASLNALVCGLERMKLKVIARFDD